MNNFLEERKADLLAQQKEKASDLFQYIQGNNEPDQTIIQRQTKGIEKLSIQIQEVNRLQRKLKRI